MEVYKGALQESHGMSETQTRVYIPQRAVFGYRNEDEMDFFTEDSEAFTRAQKIIDGNERKAKE